jgi:hypothetical protein
MKMAGTEEEAGGREAGGASGREGRREAMLVIWREGGREGGRKRKRKETPWA